MKPVADLLNLAGRVAIVTGGGKGIGRGIVLRLAEAGAVVVIADNDFTAALQCAQDCADRGGQATAMKVDVSSEPDVTHLVTTTAHQFGSVDILVNNAGIYPVSPLAATTAEAFSRIVDVNLGSAFLTTKAASEVMKAHGGGRIINITSIDALHPSLVGLAAYDASKHGLWGFTKNAALELAPHHIWVNAIAPGGILTPGTAGAAGEDAELDQPTEQFLASIPMGRLGDPDEIGLVALFLASDMAGYMTGAQIVVDGGALLT